MARPNMSAERKEQILDAFERCVLQHGIESSSLEKVALEAGMKRPIIRHYIGNRDDLVIALTERSVARFQEETRNLLENLPTENRIASLVQSLIAPGDSQVVDSVQIYESLITASRTLPEVNQYLTKWTVEFIALIESELKAAYPESSGYKEVAYGLLAIYYNYISLLPLGLPRTFRSNNIKAALRLADTLAH